MQGSDTEAILIRKLREENEGLKERVERDRLGIQALCETIEKVFPRPIEMKRKGIQLTWNRASLKKHVEELLAAYKREKGGMDLQGIVDLARPIEGHLRNAYSELWESQEEMAKVLDDPKLKHLELDLREPRRHIQDICSDMRITLQHEVHDDLDALQELAELCEGKEIDESK